MWHINLGSYSNLKIHEEMCKILKKEKENDNRQKTKVYEESFQRKFERARLYFLYFFELVNISTYVRKKKQ